MLNAVFMPAADMFIHSILKLWGMSENLPLFTCHGASSGSTGVLPKRSMSVLSALYLNGRAIQG